MQNVVVVDYGMGNLHSVAKAIEHCGEPAKITVSGRAADILKADRVVFPGVGAIRDCIGGLKELGLDEVIRQVAASRPLLGVCVGMQAMMRHSVENNGIDCLGLLPGEVRFFEDTFADKGVKGLKVPHMGWNQVRQDRRHPMWGGIEDGARFYFVHSYYVEADEPEQIQGSCEYGIEFAAAVGRDNLFAVQFHPEKSQHDGLRLYANFLRWQV